MGGYFRGKTQPEHRMDHAWSPCCAFKRGQCVCSSSTETLPPPVLTAEPSNQIDFEPDSMVQFRCVAPKAGLRFGLHREDPDERSLLQSMRSAGNEAIFQLHNVSASDAASYSCSYMELAPPFSGSAPSKFVTLTLNGELSRATWVGSPVGCLIRGQSSWTVIL